MTLTEPELLNSPDPYLFSGDQAPTRLDPWLCVFENEASGVASLCRTGLRGGSVYVAAGIVARDGIEALSMRWLATECVVSSMAPYRYIGSKEDLLRALANRYLDEVDYPDAAALRWDDYLREVFRSVRQILLRRPELVEIAARHRVNGLAGYRGAELVLGALRQAGLGRASAVSAFTALYAFTIGFVQQEVPGASRAARLAERLVGIAELPPEQFANIRNSTDDFLYTNTVQHFDRGLDFILRGVGALVA